MCSKFKVEWIELTDIRNRLRIRCIHKGHTSIYCSNIQGQAVLKEKKSLTCYKDRKTVKAWIKPIYQTEMNLVKHVKRKRKYYEYHLFECPLNFRNTKVCYYKHDYLFRNFGRQYSKLIKNVYIPTTIPIESNRMNVIVNIMLPLFWNMRRDLACSSRKTGGKAHVNLDSYMKFSNILNSRRNAPPICINCSQKIEAAIAMLSIDILSWNFVRYFLTHKAAFQLHFWFFSNISFRDFKNPFFTQKHKFSQNIKISALKNVYW